MNLNLGYSTAVLNGVVLLAELRLLSYLLTREMLLVEALTVEVCGLVIDSWLAVLFFVFGSGDDCLSLGGSLISSACFLGSTFCSG